eukprot:3735719-Pyramimonas_sp.AAC.1
MDLNSTCEAHESARPVGGTEEPERDGPNHPQLRPTLQAHQLAFGSTFYAVGLAYFGVQDIVQKRLDDVAIPICMMSNVDSCQVARTKGRTFQRIRCARPKYH